MDSKRGGVLRPGCVLGLILVGRSDLLGFHCMTRMVSQGIGFWWSRWNLGRSVGGVPECKEVLPKRSVDQCLTSQGLTRVFSQASNVKGTGTQTHARADFMSSLSTASYGTQVTSTLRLHSTTSIKLSIKSSCSLKASPKLSYRKKRSHEYHQPRR